MGRSSDALIAQLIAEHAEVPTRHEKATIADMGRAIGDDSLTRKLYNARKKRVMPPGDLILSMWLHLDQVGKDELLYTLARDAGKSIPDMKSTGVGDRLDQLLRSFSGTQRNLVRGLLASVEQQLK